MDKIHHLENERLKRAYFACMHENKQPSETPIDAIAKPINRFETHTRLRSFKAFHPGQATAFRRPSGTSYTNRRKP